jgi:agmatinase
LSPLAFDGLSAEQALELIRRQVAQILRDGKFAVTLGGEHTISTAPARAHLAEHPGMGVLQFDAHSDLRDSYQGTPWSHASVMARICEFLNPERLVQVGIRAQCIEESRMIEERRIRTFYAHEFRDMKNREQAVIDALPEEVYITFDVDFFDPSIMPATGTPEPGGCLWDETVALIKAIAAAKRIVGFDLVELAPIKCLPFPTYLAAKLVYKLLNAAFSGR